MKKYALFLGCNIPARVPQYERAARAVLARLQVDLVEIRQFNCCGYPLRNTDLETALLFSALNLALAEREDLDILTLCQCCFGALKQAAHLLARDENRRQAVNAFLSKEKLTYQGTVAVTHLLSLLHSEIGAAAIKETVTTPLADLKIAAHYGCHALRPSDIMQFDDPVAPTVWDTLVSLTGAGSVTWSQQLECCGAPLLGVNDDLSLRLAAAKLANAASAGANLISVACPWCHIQFEATRQRSQTDGHSGAPIDTILYPQLLGLAMGIPREALGLGPNEDDSHDMHVSNTQ